MSELSEWVGWDGDMDVTCYCSVHYASIFQLDCHRLVVQLHQESVECVSSGDCGKGRMGVDVPN